MVKTAQSVAHRLKEDDSGEGSGRDGRTHERNHIGIQDVGVKVGRGATSTLYTALRRSACRPGSERGVVGQPVGLKEGSQGQSFSCNIYLMDMLSWRHDTVN